MQRILLLFILCLPVLISFAQPKALQAVKTFNAPKIDGDLDDAAWQQAPAAIDFVQYFPLYGSPASAKTTVKILYDNNAVYIGAYLYDDPSLIRKQLTERDGEQKADVDYFSVFFDTYNDQQNGFQFLVTSKNVQSDAKLDSRSFGTSEEYSDKSWDAVWQSKTSMREDGWTVEIRIPYSSLRFAKNDVQTWGLQFLRSIRRNSEISFWNKVDPKENGFINQFGKYTNLTNIHPPLRLSLSPYLSTGIRQSPDQNNNTAQWLKSGGMDVKYGINESFTLDATLIPDFGQVVSDDVITNLSPYETRFRENRPFFTEGTELFNKAGLFYSRRIGAVPRDYYEVQNFVSNNPRYEVINNPGATQLYNAVKLSGRTDAKLGIGVFNAITASMNAEVRNKTTGRDSLIATEPGANYNIVVLDQVLKNRSSVTFTNTNVIRKIVNTAANVSAIDFSFYDKTNTYSVSGSARYSSIFGYTPYNGSINLTHDTITRNSELCVKPYDGYSGRFKAGKVSGKIQYFLSADVLSDKYDPTDLAYLAIANKVTYNGNISYNQFNPTGAFINYSYGLDIKYDWLYKPYSFSSMEIGANAYLLFKNMWSVSVTASVLPFGSNDYYELRTSGLFLKYPWYYFAFLYGGTDSRKRFYVSYQNEFAKSFIPDKPYLRNEIAFRYRFSDKFSLILEADKRKEGQIGYAFQREQNGNPIVGYRAFRDFTTVLSGNYNFASRVSFSLRTRHYWSNVDYLSFHNVTKEGGLTDRAFIANQNQNYNLFNVDAFFTWDFRPGSRIIAGWKNWLSGNAVYTGTDGRYFNNLYNTFNLPHGNELTLRIIYFLDYNELRCHKKL